MPLRSLARKLGAPAIATLQRGSSSPRVSPAAAGSGRRSLRSSQSGVSSREAQTTLKFMKEWNKEKERNYQEVSRLVDNLPRTIALSAAAAAALAGTSIVAYAVGAFE